MGRIGCVDSVRVEPGIRAIGRVTVGEPRLVPVERAADAAR